MKQILILTLLLFCEISWGQVGRVGVNTNTPVSTLDIVSSSTNTSSVEGLMTPQLTKDELAGKMNGSNSAAYTMSLQGDIIYITDVTPGANGSLPSMSKITTPSFYYWDGNQWQRCASANNIAWAVGGNIGMSNGVLGTEDAAPLSMQADATTAIKINSDGSINIGATSATTSQNCISISSDGQTITFPNVTDVPNGVQFFPLGIDANGLLQTSGQGIVKTMPFKYYSLKLTNCNGDWVKNFNTRISSDLLTGYTVMLVNAQLITPDGLGLNTLHPLIATVDKNIRDDNGNIVTPNQSTWYLHLDYVGSGPSGNSTWELDMIVIDNSQVNVLPTKSYNMGDSRNGDAVTAPF